jgi:hypothetical protein
MTRPHLSVAITNSAWAAVALGVFLWSLEWAGVSIALLGMGRERWLAARRR